MKLTNELMETLRQVPAGNVADNNPHGWVMDYQIQAINPKLHMIGRACTVQCAPGDNLAFHQGMDAAEKGQVIIFACGGYTRGGHFGDMMANACKIKGIAGVVIDGTCRDRNDICELEFPVYARGTCPAGTLKCADAKINVPVLCGGVVVRPNDLIFADCDGVVVIPQEYEEEVIANALKKYEKEKSILREILEGKSTMDIYGFRQVN